jgi:hypothetical protein
LRGTRKQTEKEREEEEKEQEEMNSMRALFVVIGLLLALNMFMGGYAISEFGMGRRIILQIHHL